MLLCAAFVFATKLQNTAVINDCLNFTGVTRLFRRKQQKGVKSVCIRE